MLFFLLITCIFKFFPGLLHKISNLSTFYPKINLCIPNMISTLLYAMIILFFFNYKILDIQKIMGTNLIHTCASLPSFGNKILGVHLKPPKYICSKLHSLPISQRAITVLSWVFVILRCIFMLLACSYISDIVLGLGIRLNFVLTLKFASLGIILLWELEIPVCSQI